MNLIFVTSNRYKFNEAKSLAHKYGIDLEHCDTPYIEIQADNLKDIANTSVQQACALISSACFIEDAGLFIDSLKGFPGPYSSFIFKTVGNEGILKLMKDEDNRRAEFRSVVGYCEPGHKPKAFKGKAKGIITEEKRGSRGFGFDPIFSPENTGGITFSEMKLEMKNSFSHRSEAMEKLLKWYVKDKIPSGD